MISKLVFGKNGSIRFVEMDNIWICDYCGATKAGGIAFEHYDISLRRDARACLSCYNLRRSNAEKKLDNLIKENVNDKGHI